MGLVRVACRVIPGVLFRSIFCTILMLWSILNRLVFAFSPRCWGHTFESRLRTIHFMLQNTKSYAPATIRILTNGPYLGIVILRSQQPNIDIYICPVFTLIRLKYLAQLEKRSRSQIEVNINKLFIITKGRGKF